MSPAEYLPAVFGLLGVLAGSVITHLSAWHFRAQDRESNKKIASAMISLRLDMFAEECSEVLSNNDLSRQSGGHAVGRIDKLPNFPLDIEPSELKFLNSQNLSRILFMQIHSRLSLRQVEFWWAVEGDPESMVSEIEEQCIKLGAAALEISEAIRADSGLPPQDYSTGDWDFRRQLKERLSKLTTP